MSDLSGQRQWQAPPPQAFPTAFGIPAEVQAGTRRDVQAGELRFLRLRTAAQIAQVLPLRRTIPLPAAAQADPGFADLEKKGTNSGWSAHSRTAAGSSAPCAPCH